MKWKLLSDKVPQTAEEVIEIVLANRGLDKQTFFNVKHPLDLTLQEVGLDEAAVMLAVERVRAARDSGEEIVLFGDYDVDGVCATAVMWLTLTKLGCTVRPFIPHRLQHGYGISLAGLDAIFQHGQPGLLMTVDNGIVAHEVLAHVKEQGIDVIVTDHHHPDGQLPPAAAVLHSSELCGTTVAWMVAKAMTEQLGAPATPPKLPKNRCDSLEALLDLCALATIADQVPLVGANRSFAKHGLTALQSTERTSLKTLAAVAEIDLKQANAHTVGFQIAPRINAMGRLSDGMDSLRLLCTGNARQARDFAELLQQTNTERQQLTDEMMKDAVQQALQQQEEKILVVHSTQYHEGVIGLLAGKLTERFGKPTIALQVSETVAKASVRSVAGVNIIEFIRQVREDLLEVGGHPMAAGFSVEVKKLELVKERLFTLAREQIETLTLEPMIGVDCVLPFELVDLELVEQICQLEPFGQGNSTPLFMLEDLKVLNAQVLGNGNKHLKLLVGNEADWQELRTLSVLFWNKGDGLAKLRKGQTVTVAGYLEINEWKGKRSVQMIGKAFSDSPNIT